MSPRPHPDVVARRVGAGAVLIHLPTGRVFELNDTGSRVWELLSAGTPPGEIPSALMAEFAGTLDVARREVQALLTELQDRGLILQ